MNNAPITLEELKKAVSFKIKPVDSRTELCMASITFNAFMEVDKFRSPPKKEIHKHLIELILRRIYDYNLQELYEAYDKVLTSDQLSYHERHEAFIELLRAAKRQTPTK